LFGDPDTDPDRTFYFYDDPDTDSDPTFIISCKIVKIGHVNAHTALQIYV
jgi:hypothetical protein